MSTRIYNSPQMTLILLGDEALLCASFDVNNGTQNLDFEQEETI